MFKEYLQMVKARGEGLGPVWWVPRKTSVSEMLQESQACEEMPLGDRQNPLCQAKPLNGFYIKSINDSCYSH